MAVFFKHPWWFCEPQIATDRQECERIEYDTVMEWPNCSWLEYVRTSTNFQLVDNQNQFFDIQDFCPKSRNCKNAQESNTNHLRTWRTKHDLSIKRPICWIMGIVTPAKGREWGLVIRGCVEVDLVRSHYDVWGALWLLTDSPLPLHLEFALMESIMINPSNCWKWASLRSKSLRSAWFIE